MLLIGDSSKLLEPFCPQRVLNFLPAPSYYYYEGMPAGEKMMGMFAAVYHGGYSKQHGSWYVEETMMEPLTLRTRVEEKKTILSFFFFFVLI